MSIELAVAKSHGLHVRAVRPDAREADFVASTAAIDSYDEIVEQTWRLQRFRDNPVILYAHQSRELPIGVATYCDVRNGQLECTVKFLTEDKNPKAEQVWRMVRDKELRAVSVGFMPHSYRWEKRDDREVLILSDNELMEISVVPIPANPEALAKMKAKARAEAFAAPVKLPSGGTLMPGETGLCKDAPAEAWNGQFGTITKLEPSVHASGHSVMTVHADGSVSLTTEPIPPASLPGTQTSNEKTETQMKSLLIMLGLAETATEAEALDRVKALQKRADEAETKCSGYGDLAAKIKTLESGAAKLETEKSALAKEHEKACADRDAATKRADEAEGKLIALEVDALVGKKIAPAEKDDFIALRTNSPALFKSMVEKRPDMKLTESVIAPDKANTAGGVDDLVKEFNSAGR